MPQLVEDPVTLSKSRLKSVLVAHDIALPPSRSKKQVYVELYKKLIKQKTVADFSSDEEDGAQDGAEEEAPEMGDDPRCLTDDGLKAALLKHGVKAGPIQASTRATYERKLRQLLQSSGHYQLNGAEKGALYYSDSDEEEEDGQEDDADSDSEGQEQMKEQPVQVQQASSQEDLPLQNLDFYYPQCFLPSSRLRVPASRNRDADWNALKSSERGQSRCSQIPLDISKAPSVGQCSGLSSGLPSGSQSVKAVSEGSSFSAQTFSITQMLEEMESRKSVSIATNAGGELNGSNMRERWTYRELVKDPLHNLIPDTETTPTGMYATCRRPIKGAAGRPVQYVHRDFPASPLTQQRLEVEHRLAPNYIQLTMFIFVAGLLYLIYDCV